MKWVNILATITPILGRDLSAIPEVFRSHWLLRIPLAIIIFQQDIVNEAMSVELPSEVWAMPAFSKLFVGVALILGGMITGWMGDLLSRLGGICFSGCYNGRHCYY